MFTPRLGVSFQTLSDSLDPAALQQVAASSIATLELYHPLFDRTAPQQGVALVNDALDGSDTHVASVHAPFGADIDLSSPDHGTAERGIAALAETLDLARGLQAGLVVLHLSTEPIEDAERPNRLQRARRSLTMVLPEYERAGVKLAMELLPRTCLGNTVSELLYMVSCLSAPGVGVCLDVNHFMDRYAEIPAAVRQLGSHLLTLHLSDYDGVDEKHWMPGAGVIDWPGFLAALADIGYQGPFNYEAHPAGDDPAARIADCERNFASLTGGRA